MSPSSTDLIRWSGLANLVAGALTAVFWFAHPGLENPANALLPRWGYVYTGFIALLVLFLWGLTGLYLRQLDRLGALGFAGYVLGFIGNAFFIAAGAFSAYAVPALTRDAAALVADQGPLLAGALGSFFMVTGLAFAVGYVLFGIASARAGVFPAWQAICLAVSAPVLGLSPVMPPLARILGCLLFGVVNMTLGWANWSLAAPARARAA
jgi:hypothetical protein